MTDDNTILELVAHEATQDRGYNLLVDAHGKNLYWHIRKLVLNHQDTDDVLQNVLLKVFKHIHNFKADSKLSTWLYRIAYNESMTFLTKRSKNLKISSQELQDHLVEQLQTDVYFTQDQVLLELQKALNTLPIRQRQIFNMRYYDEIKFKDIAVILELTEGAVKSSYHIAAKKIEHFIKRD